MKKFMLLYRTNGEPMMEMTPEQVAEMMKAWGAWFERAGEHLIDPGNPTIGTDKTIGGYSIVQAADLAEVESAIADHPHAAMGGKVEIYEILPTPGM